MKKLKILVAVHETLIPPDSLAGHDQRQIDEWRTEYDVVSHLKQAGHDVRCIGLLDSPGEDAELPFTRCWFGEAELMEGVLTSPASPLPSVEAVRALFARLRRRFTLVIVDSPPVAAARHTAAFAAAADYVVLVVEAERTRMADVERARATLEQLGAQVLGVVLNKRRSWVPERLSRLIWGVAP